MLSTTKTAKAIKNLSFLFLLPSLKIKQEDIQLFDDMGVVNTYMECDKLSYEFTPLYLLFKPEQFTEQFYKFCRRLENNQNFIEALDLYDGGVLFVFKIPSRFDNDVECLKNNRLQTVSPEFKLCFPMTITVVEEGKHKWAYTMYHNVFSGTMNTFQKYRREEEILQW